ncbi:MAG: putative transposase [Nonlabens sp.]|jgi:putative transposase
MKRQILQVDLSIKYYNERLPHSSLDLLTPNKAHHKTGKLKKHWKWYWKEKQIPRPPDNFYTPP